MKLILTIAVLGLPMAAAGQAQPSSPAKSAEPPVRTTTAPGSGERSRTAVNLGVRYTDRLHGFSLCPPLGVERIKQTSSRRLVGWVRRDEKTGAILWSMEVLQTKHEPSELPLSQYAQAVAKELAKTNKFEVQSTRIVLVAGKPAIHFRGIWKGAFRLWRRQTWVRIGPGKHLVLDIAGPVTDKEKLDTILTAMLDSLKLFDPKAAISECQENLARGSAVLEELSVPALRAILADKPCYYTIQLKGKTVGFIRLTESIAKRPDGQGLNVISGGALKLPKTPMQLTWKDLFSTPDRRFETWRRVTVEGRGKAAIKEIQDVIKKDHWVLVQSLHPSRRRRSWKRELPKSVRAAYLPEAFGALLPRLLDRSKPGAYAFAMYKPDKNDFDMRIIRVVGPETIRLGSQSIKATRLTDQMAQDAPVTNLWVNEKGVMLRMRTAGGLTIERADRKAVAARFAAELVELDRLGKSEGKRDAGQRNL